MRAGVTVEGDVGKALCRGAGCELGDEPRCGLSVSARTWQELVRRNEVNLARKQPRAPATTMNSGEDDGGVLIPIMLKKVFLDAEVQVSGHDQLVRHVR